MTELGKYVRGLRKEAGLGQREVARRAEIAQGTLHYIETGKTRQPSLSTLVALADVFNRPVGDLIARMPGMAGAGVSPSEEDDLLNEAILMLLGKLSPETKRQAVDILRVLARG